MPPCWRCLVAQRVPMVARFHLDGQATPPGPVGRLTVTRRIRQQDVRAQGGAEVFINELLKCLKCVVEFMKKKAEDIGRESKANAHAGHVVKALLCADIVEQLAQGIVGTKRLLIEYC